VLGEILLAIVLVVVPWRFLWSAAKSAGLVPGDAVPSNRYGRALFGAKTEDRAVVALRYVTGACFAAAVVLLLAAQSQFNESGSTPLVPSWALVVGGLASGGYWAVRVWRERRGGDARRLSLYAAGLAGSALVVVIALLVPRGVG
jgi:hypothetical protein